MTGIFSHFQSVHETNLLNSSVHKHIINV